MSRLTGHMHHNVVAYLALFIALGGTSYAAVKLPANSVGAKQIKKNAVRSPDVKNGSLLAGDFKRGQLPAGPRGPHGPQGPQGHHGAHGAPGAPGTALAFARINADGTLDASRSKNVGAVSRPAVFGLNSFTTGYYCIDATVPVRNIVATAEDPRTLVSAKIGSTYPNVPNPPTTCTSAGNDAIVHVSSAGSSVNAPFYIQLN